MSYELEVLEEIIKEIFAEPHEKVSSPTKDTEWTSRIKHEIERIKRAFIKVSFSLQNDKYIELYIQHHQTAIIHLWDSIINIQDNTSSSQKDIHHLLHTKLCELLAFVEKHFSRYFDLSAKIPESYKNIAARDFESRLSKLIKDLKKKNLSIGLISILTESFKDFIENKETKVSFRKLIYLKEFFKEMTEISKSENTNKSLERSICASMIYLNYNSPKFINHCAKVIKENYQERATLSAQLEKLSHYLKIINQQQEKPGFSYKHSQKSLKVQLSEWVIEEIIFLEKKQQLSFSFKSEKLIESSPTKDFKIHTESSVPQVAYFVRILMETGFIKNQSTIDVIRFFSSNIRTNRTESISQDSFRSKFYNTEHTTKEAVKEDVLKLLNHISKSN